MPSALILSRPGYPAMPRARQPAHQRSVLPNPLVLGETLLKFPTPTADRDRPVSRRSEPSSRTAFIGEQPNLPAARDARGRSACYPRSTFYLLSDGLSIQHRRITNADFRLCSTHLS